MKKIVMTTSGNKVRSFIYALPENILHPHVFERSHLPDKQRKPDKYPMRSVYLPISAKSDSTASRGISVSAR